jgi:sugar phosphate isomerase/epimerase
MLQDGKGAYEDQPWNATVLALAYKILYVNKPLYYYRLDASGSSTNCGSRKMINYINRKAQTKEILEQNNLFAGNIKEYYADSALGGCLFFFKRIAFEYIGVLLDMADERGFILCHENEKDIFGCSPERELELMQYFVGRLKAVLDPGNFAFCFEDASKGYPLLKDYIHYFHIKDADESGAIVPPGKGVACLEETLRAVASDRKDETVILTMEPHLMNFTGLSSLSKLDDIHHVYSFETPFEAFKVATDAVRAMVEKL